MKIYGNTEEVVRVLWHDEGAIELDDAIVDMKVPRIRRAFWPEEGPRSFVSQNDQPRLIACINDAIDGVRSLDRLVDEVRHLRGRLTEKILEMRNAYRPQSCARAIRRLREMDRTTPEDDVRKVVADILGYDELPDSFVNVSALGFSRKGLVGFDFGVRGKPTSVRAVIPAETDYANDRDVGETTDALADFPLSRLESDMPEIILAVTAGAKSYAEILDFVQGDTVFSTCSSIDVLSEKIKSALAFDVRDKIYEVRDIAEVNDIDEFMAWRMLRSADASAERNSP